MISQLARKRPFLSTIAISGTAAAGLEGYTRWMEKKQQQQQQQQQLSSSNQSSLPRIYDRQKIREYWLYRPVSVASRIVQIAGTLGPVGVHWYIDRKWNVVQENHANESSSSSSSLDGNSTRTTNQHQLLKHAQAFREALTDLGPAWIKGGQQLAIRPDLVPPVVLKELQKLCDAVQPIDDDIAFSILREELQVEDLSTVFQNLELVAAASLGQVYRATLLLHNNQKTNDDDDDDDDGNDHTTNNAAATTTVAIKVQRPGMKEAFSLDLFLLQQWGEFMDTMTTMFTNQKPYHRAFLDAFCEGSYSELDYEQEARNQRRFQKELTLRKCRVKVPDVYEDYSTERILTSEWIDGIKLADSSPKKIRQLIPVGVELFLTQLLDIGAFHADPHPGNLLVTSEEEEGGILCLLDFGLTANVDPTARAAMTNAIVHLLSRDFDTLIAKDAKALGFLPDDFDTTELKPLLTKVLKGGVLESSSNLHHRKRKLQDISNELNEIFFEYPFQVPPFFALVTRGLGLLEGIALTGDPNFDIFRASAPYATRRALAMMRQSQLSTSTSSSSSSSSSMNVTTTTKPIIPMRPTRERLRRSNTSMAGV